MVNFDLLTKKLQARMLTYPKSTMRVLRMLRRWSSGHVTLLRENFNPLNPPQSDLQRRADSRWALPKYLF